MFLRVCHCNLNYLVSVPFIFIVQTYIHMYIYVYIFHLNSNIHKLCVLVYFQYLLSVCTHKLKQRQIYACKKLK